MKLWWLSAVVDIDRSEKPDTSADNCPKDGRNKREPRWLFAFSHDLCQLSKAARLFQFGNNERETFACSSGGTIILPSVLVCTASDTVDSAQAFWYFAFGFFVQCNLKWLHFKWLQNLFIQLVNFKPTKKSCICQQMFWAAAPVPNWWIWSWVVCTVWWWWWCIVYFNEKKNCTHKASVQFVILTIWLQLKVLEFLLKWYLSKFFLHVTVSKF